MAAKHTAPYSPDKPAHAPSDPAVTSRIVVPVGYAAWLSGDLGASLERRLLRALDAVPAAKVTRMPRAFLVEADESPGPLLEAVRRATSELEASVAASYPVLHHEMGPLWTGTLQSVFA